VIIPFPTPFKETSPAGTYGYPEPDVEGFPLIDVTACLDGFRVWIGPRIYKTFVTLSNAERCASALNVLARLGALP
jgi:hypothetical protein